MADGDDRRSTRQRGKPVSYKEPPQLKFSQLEGKKDKGKEGDELSSGDEDEAEQTSGKKEKGQKKRRVSASGKAAPTKKANNPLRHSFDGSEGLLGIISNKPSAIPMAVKQWWADYEMDPAAAVGKLTNMMIEACGLLERLPPEAFRDDDEKDVDEYIQDLVENCTSQQGEGEMLVSSSLFDKKDKAAKKVQANFSDFWDKFVMHAPEVELRNLHEHPFCPWLHAMSTAALKNLRVVATSVGMDMMLAVVSKTTDAIKAMTNLERLHEVACAKKDDREIERAKEQLESKREICKDAETCILSFFNSIFVHRYKDLHPEVRVKCVQTIGKLVMEYSSKFLDNSYLKYIGWALYDKVADVRLVALEALDVFYNSSLIPNLEAFTTRFRARVLQMSYDIDKDVQIRAIETAKTMAQHDLLSDEPGLAYREEIYKMIAEEDADIRRVAANFINAIYIELDLNGEYVKTKKTAGKNAAKRDVYMTKGIVELLNVVSAGFDDMHLIMEPLLQELPFLEDLTMLCEVMLEEDGEDRLDEEQKVTLGKMIQGVMATFSDWAEADDSGQRNKKKDTTGSSKGKKATLILGENLRKLMKFFAADVAALIPLVGSLEHFQLDAFNAKDSTLKDIAETLVDITQKANDDKLLENCAIAIEHLSSANYSAKPAVEATIKNLIKTTAADFKKVYEAIEKGSKLSSVHTLTLRRMMFLAGRFDVFKVDQSIRTHAVKMLEVVPNEKSPMSSESACHAMMIVHCYIAWRLENKQHGDGIERIFEAKEELLSCCKALFERGNNVDPLLRVQASACVADCQHLLGSNLNEEERPKDLEMTKADIEDLVPVIDSALSRGADAFGRASDQAKTLKFVHSVFQESQDDPNGSMRFRSLTLSDSQRAKLHKYEQLLKTLIHCHGNLDFEESVYDMLSSLTIHRPYSQKFHQELTKVLYDHFERVPHPGKFWRSAHVRMITRIGEEIQAGVHRKVTDNMFAQVVESVGNLKMRSQDVYDYVLGGIEWVMEEWDTARAAFLDAISVQAKRLDRDQITNILATFDELCQSGEVPLDTIIEDASPLVANILKFRQFLLDRSIGNVVGPGRARAVATPNKKAGLPKARLTFTPSGTPMSSQASGGGSSSKSSSKGSSAKRKTRELGSEDEDEDGCFKAPSLAPSQAASSGKKRK